MIDFSNLSVGDRRATEACCQEGLAHAMRDMCRWCFIARGQNDIGGAASSFRISKTNAETWAAVGEIFADDLAFVMNGATPLLHNWWKAIVDCPDPPAAYEAAAAGEWSAARIRREFCEPKAGKPSPRKLHGCTPRQWVAGILTLIMPLNEEPPFELPERVTVVIEEGR